MTPSTWTRRSAQRRVAPTRPNARRTPRSRTNWPTTFGSSLVTPPTLGEGEGNVSSPGGLIAAGQSTDHLDSQVSGAELRSSVLRGLAWNTLLVITIQVTRLVTGLILVHLLEPRDYGLAGMALVFSSFVIAFSDLGLGAGL